MKDKSENCDKCYRNSPHYQAEGTTYFVTFRLVGQVCEKNAEQLKSANINLKRTPSLPLIKQMHANRYYNLLDKEPNKEMELGNPETADLVAQAIKHQHEKEYNLIAYCIMPDHVHLVFHIDQLDESAKQQNGISPYVVTNILGSLKKYTDLHTKDMHHADGETWQHESYDRILHNRNELERVISFVVHNPVEAGLVSNWQEWRWSFVTDKLKHVLEDKSLPKNFIDRMP
jgi:putative transposase